MAEGIAGHISHDKDNEDGEDGEDGEDYQEQDKSIEGWIGLMREVKENGTPAEVLEAEAAFGIEAMKNLRRQEKFREWGSEIELLAQECYPKVRLRPGHKRAARESR